MCNLFISIPFWYEATVDGKEGKLKHLLLLVMQIIVRYDYVSVRTLHHCIVTFSWAFRDYKLCVVWKSSSANARGRPIECNLWVGEVSSEQWSSVLLYCCTAPLLAVASSEQWAVHCCTPDSLQQWAVDCCTAGSGQQWAMDCWQWSAVSSGLLYCWQW